MSDNNSSESIISITFNCNTFSTPKIISLSCLLVKTAFLLPLSLSVFYFGFRQRQRPSHQAHSHADVFAFHMALLELIGVLGSFLYLGGLYSGVKHVESVVSQLLSMIPPGEILILCLTCVDRYLAVVHPIPYLQLKRGKGVVVRNVSLAVVWMVSCSFIGFSRLHYPKLPAIEFIGLLSVCLAVVSFSSAAVLRALLHPGPGDSHGDRGKVDQAKRRAFKITATIMLVQLLWFVGFLVSMLVKKMSGLSQKDQCLLTMLLVWFNIPCCLVLPLLFLQSKRRMIL